ISLLRGIIMIWHVISQVGSADNFAPALQPRLIVSLNSSTGQLQVSNNVLETIYANGLELEEVVIDLLHFAMSVYAADLRVRRRYAKDQWTRDIILYIPVAEPGRWGPALPSLTQLLSFLTGDRWEIRLRQREPISKPKLKASNKKPIDLVAL